NELGVSELFCIDDDGVSFSQWLVSSKGEPCITKLHGKYRDPSRCVKDAASRIDSGSPRTKKRWLRKKSSGVPPRSCKTSSAAKFCFRWNVRVSTRCRFAAARPANFPALQRSPALPSDNRSRLRWLSADRSPDRNR